MATAAQIKANRRNAQKSTGPVTQQGKAKVSQNRLVHGLMGRFRVLEGENQKQYDAVLDQLMVDQKPVGLLEVELVKTMSEHMWLSARAGRCQEACFVFLGQTPEQKAKNQAEVGVLADLERFTTYQAHHDRAFQRALTSLLKLRKERQLNEIGFERQKRFAAEEQRREKRQSQREERHQAAVALDKKRLELANFKSIQVGHDVAELLCRRSAASMPQNTPRQGSQTSKIAA